MIKRKTADKTVIVIMYILLFCFAILCLYPLLLTLSVSFTDNQTVATEGYSLIPKKFSTEAYSYIFTVLGSKILHSYLITFFVTIVGTACSIAVTSAYAYAASVRSFKHRNILNFLVYIPMVFSAGLLPWYIVVTRYYGLTNHISALFIPSLMNIFFVFLVRNFFSSVPYELAEAAKIDGAGHWRIFLSIYIPVAKVGLTTIILFYILSYWNDYYLALMLINDPQLYPMQYLLYNMMTNLQFVANSANAAMAEHVKIPQQTVMMALTCVTTAPILFLFPFVHRYFVKGVIIGAVKG